MQDTRREYRLKLYAESEIILKKILRNFCFPRSVDEDLKVVAKMLLWQATDMYNPDNPTGCSFRSYCWKYIFNGLKHELRDYSRLIRIPAWQQEKDPDFQYTIEDLYDESITGSIQSTDSYDNLRIPMDLLLNELPDIYKSKLPMFIDKFFYDMSGREIAIKYGVSEKYVHKTISNIKDCLYKSDEIREWANLPPIEMQGKKSLTSKELEVYNLYKMGNSIECIADLLNINPTTVDYHLSNVSAKTIDKYELYDIDFVVNNKYTAMLSSTEHKIAKYIPCSYSSDEISKILKMKKRNLDNHLQNIYRKLEVNNRNAAAYKLYSEQMLV